jgi:phospholipase/carboxylesterase
MSETLPAIEIETKPKPSHTVIWLHGLGADGNDFVPVVKEMKLPRLGIRFVFPHAPMRPVTINGGFVMRAWYDIAYQELAFKEDERGLRESQKLIEELIVRENTRGIPSSRIVLAGFSQGGVLALQTGLRQSKPLAGLMALSSYLPMSPMIEVERNAASNLVPVFMGHGITDNIVPLALGKMSRDTLIKLGYEVEWHQYTMPHSVCAEELADIGVWLKRVLL